MPYLSTKYRFITHPRAQDKVLKRLMKRTKLSIPQLLIRAYAALERELDIEKEDNKR